MRKRVLLSLLFLLTAVLFSTVFSTTVLPAKAEAKTWTVDDDGSADFHTIQEAINVATEGDVISVKSGVYYERIKINKTVALIGENKDTTIIDGNAEGTVVETLSDFVSISGFTIQDSGNYSSNLIRLNSKGNSVTNNVLRNSGDRGIEVNYVNNIVSDNQVTNTYYGILLMTSSGNKILRNDVSSAIYGIMLYDGCCENLVHANKISNNSNMGIFIGPVPASGVSRDSRSNTVSDNKIFNNCDGVSLGGFSFNTTLINNTIEHNDCGIGLQGADAITLNGNATGTIVYHNNFIDNKCQTSNFGTVSWDAGYPTGGNYWSDYQGTDKKSGPTQDISGSDGIGDSPYGEDRYPLMSPFKPIPTPTPTPNPTPSPTPISNQSFFFVKSNSTVSDLFFNSTSAELRFTVTGESGTSGYVEVTISKSLVSSIQDVKVYLDGNQLSVAVNDDGDAWLLLFTYTHSTHEVLVSLAAAPEVGVESLAWAASTVIVGVLFAVGVASKCRRRGEYLPSQK